MAQNTLIFQKSNPLQALTGMARTIALPHEFAPVRFPSFPALERTAVMGFTQPYQWDPPSTTAVNRIVLTRQATYPLWVDMQVTAALPFAYGVRGTMGSINLPVDYTYYPGGEVSCGPLAGFWTGAAVGGFPAAPTGTYPGFTLAAGSPMPMSWPILGRAQYDNNNSFIYAPKGCTVCSIVTHAVDLPGAGIKERFVFHYDVYQPNGELTRLTAQDGGAIVVGRSAYASFVSSENQWIRLVHIYRGDEVAGAGSATPIYHYTIVTSGTVSFTNAGLMQTLVTITPGGQVALLPFKTVPEFLNSKLPYSATRLTAAAVLLTNVTPVLNKAGTFLGGRVNPRVDHPFNVTEDSLAALHPAEKAFLNAETGFYTYCPPSTDLATFYDYTDSSINGLVSGAPVYRLDNDAMVNVIFFRDNLAANFAVTVDWHLEFRNSSALFQVGMSGATLETLHQAQLTLASLGYFFSNEEHKYTIGSIIAAVGRKALDYVPFGGHIKKALGTQIVLGSKSSAPKPTQAVPTKKPAQIKGFNPLGLSKKERKASRKNNAMKHPLPKVPKRR